MTATQILSQGVKPSMANALAQLKTSIPIAHIFDVDQRTGFMPPRPPLSRLPEKWVAWETTLDAAIEAELQLGDKVGLTEAEEAASKQWRDSVRKLAMVSTDGLGDSPDFLRRAHLVLAFILHFYVQTLPPVEEVSIPRSISIPILQVAKQLDLPPVLTFSDTVLYNWEFKTSPKSEDDIPTASNIHTQTMFTKLVDEEEFYLCSARIEMRGVEILELMRATMDETFVGDIIAVRRIKEHLCTVAGIIADLKDLLFSVKNLCNPNIYYNQVRPWLRGEDAYENKRKWIFESANEKDFQLSSPIELSGPSAGQSAMIHALDIFLGVDHQAASPGQPSFMSRMQSYMPRNHRLFLDHLKANPRPLRAFVMDANDVGLLEAYNIAVLALKEFRDAHMIIAALYVLGPARRAKAAALGRDVNSTTENDGVKGTGGTNLVKFLKDVRNRTGKTIIP